MSTEAAWAAGFFDGEGHTGTNDTRLYLRVGQAVSSETLDRFQLVMGFGRVHPTTPTAIGTPMWCYQISGAKVFRAMDKLWPYLSTPKKQQFIDAHTRWRTHKILMGERVLKCGNKVIDLNTSRII